jgi:HK97 family phage major capsid protein
VDPTNLASEFIEFLRPQTIIGRIPGLRRVPFNVRIVGQTSGASASWVGQGANKPVTKFDVEATTLTWAKIAAIAVFSDELFRFSSPSAEGLIRDELSKAVIARMDTDFIDPTKAIAANVSPASITNGLVAGVPSGTDAAAVRADVATMLATFLADNQSPVGAVWIMPNTLALQLSLMRNALGQPEFSGLGMLGGTFEGLPVVTSQYAAVGSPVSNLVILANAPEIFLSDDGGVSIDVSREASIEMSDDPDASGESQTIVNMFQSNQIAIRAERYINWARRRAAAVTYMSDVAWGSGS